MKTRSNRPRKKPNPVAITSSAGATDVSPPGRAGLPVSISWVALPLLAFLVYLPVLRAGFIWDDNSLTDNPYLGSLSGLWRIWTAPKGIPYEQHYWPLVYSSFWLEHLVAGLHPIVYHLDNVLLHGAVALLFWRVLQRLDVPGAWLAAALFAVHPVHAESVAWVIERKDVLSGVFYMGAVLAFLKWDFGRLRPQNAGADQTANSAPESLAARNHYLKYYLISLVLFAAALLSKSIVVTLPVALALLLWLRHGQLTRDDVLALVPFGVLGASITLADLHLFHGLRIGQLCNLGLFERILMAGGGIWVYLSKLFWPWPLATFYPQWTVSRAAVSSWLPLLALLPLLAGLWFARKRIGRGPFAAVAFFCLTLAPVLGIVDYDFLYYSWVSDRYQYLASASPLALVAAGLVGGLRKVNWPSVARQIATGVLLILPGLLCLHQASFYHDSITLFKSASVAYPRYWAAQFNYSWALSDEGRIDEALKVLRDSLRLDTWPDYHMIDTIVLSLAQRLRFQEAEEFYKQTLAVKPDYAEGHMRYGAFLAGQERLEDAVAEYRKGLNLKPDDAAGLNNLGDALHRLHHLDEAADCLTRAVRQAPQRADYRTNLARVLFDQGKYPQALEQCQSALRLDPSQVPAYIISSQALLARGECPQALVQLEQARRLQPQNAFIYYLTGVAYQMLGNAPEAVRAYRETLNLQPDFPEVAMRLKSLEGMAMMPPR